MPWVENLQIAYCVNKGWGTCGPREHLIWPWPASEFSLPKWKTQHRVKTKLDDKQTASQEISFAPWHSFFSSHSFGR